jgi:hypothetical protein
MKKEETISREEAEKMCKEMANTLKKGVFNELDVLNNRLFQVAALENEIEPIFFMAGDFLKTVITHLEDNIDDIQAGRYLPKKAEVTA